MNPRIIYTFQFNNSHAYHQSHNALRLHSHALVLPPTLINSLRIDMSHAYHFLVNEVLNSHITSPQFYQEPTDGIELTPKDD